MKTQNGVFSFFAAIVLLSVNPAFAQSPPPNDDFTNSTVLSGSSITFTGTLAGATFETGEPDYSPTGASVWWTWTAPQTTRVVLSILRTSSADMTNGNLQVFLGTNLNNPLIAIDSTLFSDPPGHYISFQATGGARYQFRAQIPYGGTYRGPFTVQLTATNPPVFIFQPQNCTVSPYGSAFFSAMATGPRVSSWTQPASTAYQWLFNGDPIPGKTSPSLLIHSVTTNESGSYSVIASNVGGVMQSAPATLTVVDTNPIPRIVVLPTNNPTLVSIALTGEPGRWYKIETSTDLQNWINPVVRLQLTNETTVITVSRLGTSQFFRASLSVHTDVCVAQLKQMRWGLKLVTIESRLSPFDTYTLNQLYSFVPLNSNGQMSYCPDGGVYASGGSVRDSPTCSLGFLGHVITDGP